MRNTLQKSINEGRIKFLEDKNKTAMTIENNLFLESSVNMVSADLSTIGKGKEVAIGSPSATKGHARPRESVSAKLRLREYMPKKTPVEILRQGNIHVLPHCGHCDKHSWFYFKQSQLVEYECQWMVIDGQQLVKFKILEKTDEFYEAIDMVSPKTKETDDLQDFDELLWLNRKKKIIIISLKEKGKIPIIVN